MATETREARVPKRIHYCWFGRQPLSVDAQAMIATWRRFCPDYEIIEWNESNFDISGSVYARDAYAARKWAFVSDYVRLRVLYEYGGIYMDTDVEVVRPFDDLLKHEAFMCFEGTEVSIGTFGIEPHHPLTQELLKWYDTARYVPPEQGGQVVTNLQIVTRVLHERYGLQLNGRRQVVGHDIVVYPMDYFIAKIYQLGWICPTENTYAIHHYAASWVSDSDRLQAQVYREQLQKAVKDVLPLLMKYAGIRTAYKQKGLAGAMAKVISSVARHLCAGGGHHH